MRSRIICVDDQMGIRMLLKEVLKEDYNVETVGSGKEAIKILEGFKPDIVMLDMYLGDMTGMDVFSHIKKLNSNTKVVVMSGFIENDMRAQLDLLKPEYILNKPFDVFTVKSQLKSMMDDSLNIEICS